MKKELYENSKSYTVEEINNIVGGILNKVGESVKINRIASPGDADENTLALAFEEKFIETLPHTKAKVALVPLGVSIENLTTIEVERPKLAMMKILHLFYIPPDAHSGVHPSAIIHPDSKLGKDVSIGPNVVIGRGAVIGDNTKILANVYVGKFSEIGKNCLLYPGVYVGDCIEIGNNVIIHNGASIGADGYSFVTETPSNVEAAKQSGQINDETKQQKIYKVPSLGAVTISDDVEIGANSAIDRGTIENTFIGKGTKIDNLVQIGHNCIIGENCLIISQAGVSGSVKLGDRVVLAGQAGIVDHLEIGSDSIIMAKSGVTKTLPNKSIVMGTPAIPRKEFVKQIKNVKELDVLLKEVKTFKKDFDSIKESLNIENIEV